MKIIRTIKALTNKHNEYIYCVPETMHAGHIGEYPSFKISSPVLKIVALVDCEITISDIPKSFDKSMVIYLVPNKFSLEKKHDKFISSIIVPNHADIEFYINKLLEKVNV